MAFRNPPSTVLQQALRRWRSKLGEGGEWTPVEKPMPVFVTDGVEPRQRGGLRTGKTAAGGARKHLFESEASVFDSSVGEDDWNILVNGIYLFTYNYIVTSC